MLTHSLVRRVVVNPKRSGMAIGSVAAVTVILIFVGRYFECGKAVEFGSMWLFEQAAGGFKAAFAGKVE